MDVIESIVCNKCGKEYNDKKWVGRLHEFSIDFAHYYSQFDTQKWSFDLCDDCVFEIVRTFKHLPDGFLAEGSTAQFLQSIPNKNDETLSTKKQEINEESDEIPLFSALNDLDVVDIGGGPEIEYVLVEQTNEFCLLLSKIKSEDWEKYLKDYSDGEYVDIAPLAWELGADSFDKTIGFHVKKEKRNN